MKIAINIVLAIVVIIVATGYFMKYQNQENAEGIIGVGILIMAFVLMPLFLIHRYKGKDIRKYVDGIDLNKMEQSQYEEEKEHKD